VERRAVVAVEVGAEEDRAGKVVVGVLEAGIGRVVVGGIAAVVVEEDGCGLVGGEACVLGAHGGATASLARLWSPRSLGC